MKTLGLIGGMSWESTALYYRLINEAAKARLGGLHSAQLLLWSFDFAPIAERQQSGDWSALELVMKDAARRLVSAGADAIVICSNTMHKLHGEVQSAVDVPVLHIVDVTAVAMKQKGCARPILLGTRYTMEQPFYLGRLAKAHGIQAIVPVRPARRLSIGSSTTSCAAGSSNPSQRRCISPRSVSCYLKVPTASYWAAQK